MSAKFRSLEDLKKDMSQLDLLVETDFQVLSEPITIEHDLKVCFSGKPNDNINYIPVYKIIN